MISLKIPLVPIFFAAFTLNRHCSATKEDNCRDTLSLYYNADDDAGLLNVQEAFRNQSVELINKTFPYIAGVDPNVELTRLENLDFVMGYFNALFDSLITVMDIGKVKLEDEFCKDEAAAEKQYMVANKDKKSKSYLKTFYKMVKQKFIRDEKIVEVDANDIKQICDQYVNILLAKRDQYPVDIPEKPEISKRWSNAKTLYSEWTFDSINKNSMASVDYGMIVVTANKKLTHVTFFGKNFFGTYRTPLYNLGRRNDKIPDVETHCKQYAETT